MPKAGVNYSTLWSENFDDEFFKAGLATWLKTGQVRHRTTHVKPLGKVKIPPRAKAIAQRIAVDLRRRKSIMGVFDEGCSESGTRPSDDRLGQEPTGRCAWAPTGSTAASILATCPAPPRKRQLLYANFTRYDITALGWNRRSPPAASASSKPSPPSGTATPTAPKARPHPCLGQRPRFLTQTRQGLKARFMSFTMLQFRLQCDPVNRTFGAIDCATAETARGKNFVVRSHEGFPEKSGGAD